LRGALALVVLAILTLVCLSRSAAPRRQDVLGDSGRERPGADRHGQVGRAAVGQTGVSLCP
jgi:hypothetical protein